MYSPEPVSDEQVDAYRGLIEYHAAQFAQHEVPLAEFDDLVQVGMIRVWTLIRRGIPPAEWSIVGAMRDELRRCYRISRLDQDAGPLMDDLDAEFLALDGLQG